MDKIDKPHDSFFKSTMIDPRIAKDFFSAHLPEKLKQKIDLNSLAIEKSDFIDLNNKDKKKRNSDILYSANINNRKGYLYLLAEHQSTVKPLMPLRMMKYLLAIVSYHVKKEKTYEFPIIWPIVFYNGQIKYNGKTHFLEMYPEEDRELAKEILTNPFQLVDLNELNDKEQQDHIWATIMELSMQANLKHYRDHLDLLAEKLSEYLVKIEFETGADDLIQEIICYTMSVADTKGGIPEDYIKILTKKLSEDTRGKVMNLMDKFINKRIEKRTLDIVSTMLEDNVDVKTIRKYTKLPIEEIKKVQSKDNNHTN